jgi:hypothetical protein
MTCRVEWLLLIYYVFAVAYALTWVVCYVYRQPVHYDYKSSRLDRSSGSPTRLGGVGVATETTTPIPLV